MPSDGMRGGWAVMLSKAGKLEGCLRGVVGRAHGFMGLSDPQRHTINAWQGFTFDNDRYRYSFNSRENTLYINIYNFAFAGPSVSAFSLSFSTLLKIFPLTLIGISSTNFTPPLSFL